MILPTMILPQMLDVVFDENALVDWLVDAHPGEHIVYYRGFLGLDRCKSGRIEDEARRRRLVAVANRIVAAAEQGLIMPVQKRIGEEDALYIAVRSLRAPACRPAPRACGATASRIAMPIQRQRRVQDGCWDGFQSA